MLFYPLSIQKHLTFINYKIKIFIPVGFIIRDFLLNHSSAQNPHLVQVFLNSHLCLLHFINKNYKKNRNAIADVFAPTQSNAPHRISGVLCVFSTCFPQSKSIKKGSLFSQPLAHSPPFFIHLHPIQKTNDKNTQKPLPSYYYIINLIIHSQHPTQSP